MPEAKMTKRMTKKPTIKSAEDVEVNETPEVEVSPVSVSDTTQVKLAKDHDCCIGGAYYRFKSGKIYDVPVGVASVLRRGDLLRPID